MCKEISSISDSLLAYGGKIIPARHKRIINLDREYQICGAILGATTKKELEAFLENIQKYWNSVGRAISVGPLDFASSSCPSDVNDLLRVLRDYYKDA